MNIARQHAELAGRELAPGEGYSRTNDGGWVIIIDSGVQHSEENRRLFVVDYCGTAKKNLYAAPDPEGFAIAQRIVELWNTAQ